MEWFAVAGSALALSLLASCNGDDGPKPVRECANVASSLSTPSCTPLYEPSYENVFARTLKPTCAKSGISCHASTGRQGNLSFEDADEAYGLLLDTTQAVRPGEPSCSAIVARIAAVDSDLRMPPGRSLEASEQCSVIQWIANGAKR